MDSIIQALSSGLPVLFLQLATASLVLAAGIAIYTAITPYHELKLVREGNVAAAIAFTGAVVSMALPICVTLATSLVTLDIVVWGTVAVVLQLAAFLGASRLVGGMRQMIEANNCAAATVLLGVQLGAALLNAAALAG